MLGIPLAVAAAAAVWYFFFTRSGYVPPPRSLDGSSTGLQHTIVVPTLDTPIPKGKSAIWCSSFQMAWNRLRDDVVKEPIRLEGVGEIVDRLNQADQSESDLEADSYYAAAGLAAEGIVSKVQKDMAARFPGVALPSFDVPPDGALAFAYLKAGVKFPHPYSELKGELAFRDSTGKETSVTGFGAGIGNSRDEWQCRPQIQVLLHNAPTEEFAVDLCRDSRPYQVVVAVMPRRTNLAEAVERLGEQMRANPVTIPNLGPGEELSVPNIHWRIEHRFKELEGRDKPFQNPNLRGMFIDPAWQLTEFRLDRSGALVESQALIVAKSAIPEAPREFIFDRPFLIIMKKRNAKHPFFVMWVDNAELLCKK
jgi:hypothetical protein